MNIQEFDLEIRRHKHILICGDNQNTLGIIRSLGEKGISPIVILIHENHTYSAKKSKFINTLIITESEKDSLLTLKQFGNKYCKPFVYTTDDNHQRLLDLHYEELKDYFYFFNAGENGRITYYMDKNNICDLASECGLNVPKKEIVNTGELPTKLTYPIYAKAINPYTCGWKHDAGVFYNIQDLKKGYSQFIGKKLLLQEYISKKSEFSITGISIENGKHIYMPFVNQYLHNTASNFGGYSCCKKFTDDNLRKNLSILMQKIKYNGIFCADFIEDLDSKPIFLEVNFRSGASNYGINYGGFNIPYTWCLCVLSNRINTSNLHL